MQRILAFMIVLAVPLSAFAQSLPGTQPLAADQDFSATMLRGLHAMADRLTERSKEGRKPTREKLAEAIGIVDPRLPVTALELVGDTTTPALVMETERCRVFRVRWPVFDGVWGEGLHVQPKEKPVVRVVCLPDAEATPEACLDSRLLASDCEVVIMALVSRGTAYSTTDRLGIRTNIPHREWIYRQSWSLGRHPIGYEVQKALAVVDFFAAQPDRLPLIAAGIGEGGMLALHAAAIDERIDGVFSAGSFGPREAVWREPLDRNVCGLLRDCGDAEVAALIAPRPVVLMHAGYPEHLVSPEAREGVKAVAAPGRLTAPTRESFEAEIARARATAAPSRILAVGGDTPPEAIISHLLPAVAAERVAKAARSVPAAAVISKPAEDAGRQKRLVRDLERFTQDLIVTAEAERDTRFWKQMRMARS